MLRKSMLMLATSFAAGLLFINLYNSMIDAVNWGSNIPTSIQTARDYFKTVNPGDFFRVFTPMNQVLALLALIVCWKAGKSVRLYCGVALLFSLAVDVMTFGFFYPRNDIMFINPIQGNIDAIKTAWSQWSSVNWIRSGLQLMNLVFDFAALSLLLKTDK